RVYAQYRRYRPTWAEIIYNSRNSNGLIARYADIMSVFCLINHSDSPNVVDKSLNSKPTCQYYCMKTEVCKIILISSPLRHVSHSHIELFYTSDSSGRSSHYPSHQSVSQNSRQSSPEYFPAPDHYCGSEKVNTASDVQIYSKIWKT